MLWALYTNLILSLINLIFSMVVLRSTLPLKCSSKFVELITLYHGFSICFTSLYIGRPAASPGSVNVLIIPSMCLPNFLYTSCIIKVATYFICLTGLQGLQLILLLSGGFYETSSEQKQFIALV